MGAGGQISSTGIDSPHVAYFKDEIRLGFRVGRSYDIDNRFSNITLGLDASYVLRVDVQRAEAADVMGTSIVICLRAAS